MDAELKFKISGPEEYVPGGNVVYPDEVDDEPPHFYREDKRRRGGFDMRWDVMVRDSLCCRKCGKVVNYSTARIDHIIPVKNFASFRQAHRMDNLQTLCVPCHQEKTNVERHSQR